MSVHEFVFAMQAADSEPAHDMMPELARSVLDSIGYAPDVVEELVRLVTEAGSAGPSGMPCRVRFAAHRGELHIAVTRGDREWQTRRPLP